MLNSQAILAQLARVERQLQELRALSGVDYHQSLQHESIAGKGQTVFPIAARSSPSPSIVYDQVIAIAGDAPSATPDAGGFFDATIQPRVNAAFTTDKAIWAVDTGGSASLTVGDLFPAVVVRDNADNPVSEPGGPYYVSLANSNTEIALSDDTRWLPIVGSTTPAAWDSGEDYVIGNLVEDGGEVYVAHTDNTNDQPPSSNWTLLDDGVSDRGGYRAQATYSAGHLVREVRDVFAINTAGSSASGTQEPWVNCTISGTTVTVRAHEELPLVTRLSAGRFLFQMSVSFPDKYAYTVSWDIKTDGTAFDTFGEILSMRTSNSFVLQTASGTDPAIGFGADVHGRINPDDVESTAWYCMEPPEGGVGMVETECCEDPLPESFDLYLAGLDAGGVPTDPVIVVPMVSIGGDDQWVGRKAVGDRGEIVVRITCMGTQLYLSWEVGPFRAFGLTWNGAGLLTVSDCDPFTFTATMNILMNNGFETWDTGFDVTATES
jgi:hypothetical protein